MAAVRPRGQVPAVHWAVPESRPSWPGEDRHPFGVQLTPGQPGHRGALSQAVGLELFLRFGVTGAVGL